MTTWLAAAFSLNMLAPESHDGQISFRRISPDEAAGHLRAAGDGVGYTRPSATLARAISEELGITLPVHRRSVMLRPGDRLIAAIPSGPRIEPDAPWLPEGTRISYYLVELDARSNFALRYLQRILSLAKWLGEFWRPSPGARQAS